MKNNIIIFEEISDLACQLLVNAKFRRYEETKQIIKQLSKLVK